MGGSSNIKEDEVMHEEVAIEKLLYRELTFIFADVHPQIAIADLSAIFLNVAVYVQRDV